MKTRIKEFIKKNIPTAALVSYIILAVSVIIKIAAVISEGFADFFNRYISSIPRWILAKITSVFPFSLAETILILLIPAAVFTIVYIVKKTTPESFKRVAFSLLGVIAVLYSAFLLNFSVAYDCTPINEKIGIERKTPTKEELLYANAYALVEIKRLCPNIIYDKYGASVMPYSYAELCDKLNASYDKLCEEYSFISPLNAPVKRLALSEPMTYTHLSGIYTYYTGEANVNINYPDYVNVFTTAHEMAHQRGIAREEEASFIAFLVCINSGDDYIKYSAYVEIQSYLVSALYQADKEEAQILVSKYPIRLKGEHFAYSNMFDKYRDNMAAAATDAINDTYLKGQGQSAGSGSYDLVTELAASYLVELYNQAIQ